MNKEQKQRAAQMLRRFSLANPRTLSADNAAVDMAALLHELIDADDKFKSSVREAINAAAPEARSVIVDGTPVFFSREGDDITDTHTLTPCPHCGGSGAADDCAPEPEPVAHAVILPNGMTRIWFSDKERGEQWRKKEGIKQELTPLYPAPPAPSVPDSKTLQFLTDVLTAAGLLRHGKKDAGLATRIADESCRIRQQLFTQQPEPPAELVRDAESDKKGGA